MHHPWIIPPYNSTLFKAYINRIKKDDHEGFLQILILLAKINYFNVYSKNEIDALAKEIIKNGFFWRIPTPPNEKMDIGKPALLLDLIYNTKLYWALERCLMVQPDQRYCLFI